MDEKSDLHNFFFNDQNSGIMVKSGKHAEMTDMLQNELLWYELPLKVNLYGYQRTMAAMSGSSRELRDPLPYHTVTNDQVTYDKEVGHIMKREK